MENRKYKICRDNIFAGEVIRTDEIYRYDGDTNFFKIKPGKLYPESWISYRSILFVPNEEKLAIDLLYQSPYYPILNVTDDEICLNLKKNSIVIKDACNLAELLEYFGYNKDLTLEDILKIRKTFFSVKFAMDNCELFGWKEVKPEDWTYSKNGVEITDPKELKKLIAQERKNQREGNRLFFRAEENVLPREYWEALNELGDDDYKKDEKRDVFTPNKEEGPIKKLTKF